MEVATGNANSSRARVKKFQAEIWRYYRAHGRDLPWRKTRDPYKILVSEIMLQQTQVSTVIPKYEKFLKRFPTIQTLARASNSSVLKLWQGLGYNRRALALKRLSEIVMKEHNGKLPADYEKLVALPGVGPATAGGVLAFAFNEPVPFIETNIRRIFIHHFFADKKKIDDKLILPLVEKTLDRKNTRQWYWALYDYGSYLGKQMENPNRRSKHYTKQSAFEGSNRQLRGEILRLLLQEKTLTLLALQKKMAKPKERVLRALDGLVRERMIQKRAGKFELV